MPRNRETTYSGVLGEWERLLNDLEAHIIELPQLEHTRSKLTNLLGQAHEASRRQGHHITGKQEASLQLQAYINEGQRLATIIRFGLKAQYGPRSEKLAEFGIQPYRGRKRKPAPTEPTEPAA